MPELPEVEHVRLSLEPMLVEARVTHVRLRRRDFVRQRGRVSPDDLLHGAVIDRLLRHGKDLAIVARDGRTVGVHLGMSGWLSWQPLSAGERTRERDPHVHCVWVIDGPRGRGVLRFRDPRRFGGLWTFGSPEAWAQEKLAGRGPDALAVTPRQLAGALDRSRRPIKAALLDQAVLAGVGNIYADEALFHAGVHPGMSAHRFAKDAELIRRFCTGLRAILRRAIKSGGSTVRTYRGVRGEEGMFAVRHLVYGRAGRPCVRCGSLLRSMQLAQRTTVFCPQCQARSRRANRQADSAG